MTIDMVLLTLASTSCLCVDYIRGNTLANHVVVMISFDSFVEPIIGGGLSVSVLQGVWLSCLLF